MRIVNEINIIKKIRSQNAKTCKRKDGKPLNLSFANHQNKKI